MNPTYQTLILFLGLCIASFSYVGAERYHRDKTDRNVSPKKDTDEDMAFWRTNGQDAVRRSVQQLSKPNTKLAKNVILFIGDGMSLPTLTAARIYKAQQVGGDFQTSESHYLTFETLPHLGHSKTFNIDRQTSDSASTASAMYSGVKTKYKTMGFDSSIDHYDVDSMINGTQVDTILTWAQQAGKHTGIVTTARLTHATPAALYAHTYDRNWECDAQFEDGDPDKVPPQGLHDIAWQLVHEAPGNQVRVLMGGGAPSFYPVSRRKEIEGRYPHKDEDDDDFADDCFRMDGLDLDQAWQDSHENSKVVTNLAELNGVKPDETDYLMGLFSLDHTKYDHERDPEIHPSLTDMTKKAIEMLRDGDDGFFLMVEGGRIDHAHHQARANKALSETVSLDSAVEAALEMLKEELDETLIIVTADHAHTMTVAGYSDRGEDIRGLNTRDMDDGMAYTTLSYANGPGFEIHNKVEDGKVVRVDPRKFGDDVLGLEFVQTGSAPRHKETHGADDVGIFAQGPWSHLFHTVHDQTHIAYVMAYSACVGPFADEEEDHCQGGTGAATSLETNSKLLAGLLLIFVSRFWQV